MGVFDAILDVPKGIIGAETSSQKAARRSQTAQMQRQLELSSQEFDKRFELAGESFDTQLGLLETAQFGDGTTRGQQQTASDLFKEGLSTEQQLFDLYNQEGTNRLTRDQATIDDFFSQTGNIFDTRVAGQDAATEAYNSLVEAANLEQAGFRDQADAIINDTINRVGFDAFNVAQQRAFTGRQGFVESAAGAPVPDLGIPMSDTTRASFEGNLSREGAKVDDRIRQQSGLLSLGDAVTAGDRVLSRAGEDLGVTESLSRTAAAPVSQQLQSAAEKFKGAGVRSGIDTSLAEGARDTALAQSEANFTVATDPKDRYLRQSYGNTENYLRNVDAVLNDYFNSRLQSESNFTGRLTGISKDFENTAAGITDFRIANTRPDPSLYTQAGTTLGKIALGAAVNKAVGG